MAWLEQFITTELWGYALRIAIACVLGGAIGFERTKRLKEAGIRTHCIIASAAALMMILSKYGFADLEKAVGSFYPGTRGADPSRIASQIVSGISFLGVGVIFRNGKSVKGLTTAAGIWATAAVGMAVGSGMYLLGLAETVLVVSIQLIFHRFNIGNDAYSESEIRIVAEEDGEFQNSLTQLLNDKRIQILSMRIERSIDGEVLYNLSIRTKKDFKATDAMRIFHNVPSIHSISM